MPSPHKDSITPREAVSHEMNDASQQKSGTDSANLGHSSKEARVENNAADWNEEGGGLKICLMFHALKADHIDQIQGVVPQADITFLSGDAPSEKVTEALRDAHIAFGWPSDEALEEATQLKWIHLPSAGADRYVHSQLLRDRGVTVTNSSGVFGIPISEHVMALLLALTRQVHTFVRAQGEREWVTGGNLDELYEKTIGILGLGDIGSHTARRAKAFGMKVLAMKRNPSAKPDYVDELFGPDGLDHIIENSDVLAICLPGTSGTRHMINRERLFSMKPGSYLINIGRGSIIDEEALIDCLREGPLAAAGLDVFETEPLPKESPLWSMENVIITPHASGRHARHPQRTTEIFCGNLKRFITGEPLENTVDLDAGY